MFINKPITVENPSQSLTDGRHRNLSSQNTAE